MILHKNSETDNLETSVLNNLHSLSSKITSLKDLLKKYLNHENCIYEIRTARQEIITILGLTILENKTHGKKLPSNLQAIFGNKA